MQNDNLIKNDVLADAIKEYQLYKKYLLKIPYVSIEQYLALLEQISRQIG